MSASLLTAPVRSLKAVSLSISDVQRKSLLQGDVLAQTYPHTAWGGAVIAYMYIPKTRSHVWQGITNYSQWIDYFPDMVSSQVLAPAYEGYQRLYQSAEKAFLFFSAQAEVYLQVFEQVVEKTCQQVLFRLERGSFSDFAADLNVQDWENGTLLTYIVQATPTFPVPSLILEQAMRHELPANMRVMRQVLCSR
jgi:hypothetical protein